VNKLEHQSAADRPVARTDATSPKQPSPRSPPAPHAHKSLTGHSTEAVASALTRLSERLYHLAATSAPPFGNPDTLIDTLVHVWTAVLNRT